MPQKKAKKELALEERCFRVIKEKVSRDEFLLLEKLVAVLEKTRK